MAKNQIIDKTQAKELFEKLGPDYFLLHNPSYVYPKYEVIPLAQKTERMSDIQAFVTDMDGTTTTTEVLCIHSLEYMVRRISSNITPDDWSGLDKEADYPNIIGNSTTKHVEFLMQKYQAIIQKEAFQASYLEAIIWTLQFGRDPRIKEDLITDLKNNELDQYINKFKELEYRKTNTELASKLPLKTPIQQLKAAIIIYYYRYHFLLSLIQNDDKTALKEELPFMDPNIALIAPIAGIAEFLALIKGLLSPTEEVFQQVLTRYKNFPHSNYQSDKDAIYRKNFMDLCQYFSKKPARISIVTSSIFFEANIVMKAVFGCLRKQLSEMIVSDAQHKELEYLFADYNNYYDGFITADDSSEIRLKPHRDLYSIALHTLGVSPNQFNQVVGYEDSTSGLIAIRAAGVGMSIAVPHADTKNHNFSSASHICPCGVLDAVFNTRSGLK